MSAPVETPTPAPERTALYRFYNATGALLYVGITKVPAERWRDHSRTARTTWWPLVHRKALEWLPSREVAELAETTAIETEKPLYNSAKRNDLYAVPYEPSPEIGWGADSTAPASIQIVRILRKELNDGLYAPGEVMPTGQDFADRFKVNRTTAYKALRALADEGLLRRETLRGPFIVVQHA